MAYKELTAQEAAEAMAFIFKTWGPESIISGTHDAMRYALSLKLISVEDEFAYRSAMSHLEAAIKELEQ